LHRTKLSPKRKELLKPTQKAVTGNTEILFTPIPNSPQEVAYFHPADELYYGGQAGGGKTMLIIGLAAEHHRSLILRREFPRARAIIEKSREVYARALSTHHKDSYNESLHLWRFADGSTLQIGACQFDKDWQKYQGQEHSLKCYDEICEFTENQFRSINIWNRHPDPNERCRVIATGNPPTTTDGEWVMDYWSPFIDPDNLDKAEEGSLVWYVRAPTVDGDIDLEIARTSRHEVEASLKNKTQIPRPTHTIKLANGSEKILIGRSRSFIRSRVEDNPYMMAIGYDSKLDALPEFLRQRFREGLFQRVTESTDTQLIPTAWIIDAQQRWIDFIGNKNLDSRKAIAAYQTKTETYKMTSLGVDPARGGDDEACIAARFGDWIAPIYSLAGKMIQDGDDIRDFIQGYMIGSPQIYIDVIGIGSSPYDSCRRMGWQIHPVNVGASAVDRAGKPLTDRTGLLKFANIRTLLAWKLMEALDPQYNPTLMLPPDPKLKQELCNIRRASTDGGVITLEGKDKLKARIGRSPDRADAVQLCLMEKLSQPAIIQKSQAMALEKIRGWS
jgi:hypothetical protein